MHLDISNKKSKKTILAFDDKRYLERWSRTTGFLTSRFRLGRIWNSNIVRFPARYVYLILHNVQLYVNAKKKPTNTTAETLKKKKTDNTSFTVLYNIFKKKMLTIRPIALKYSTVNFAKPFLVQNFLAFHFRISFIYFGSLKRRLRRFKRKEPTVEDNLLSHTAICPVMWFLSQVLILWFYLKVTISAQHCKRFRTKKLWMILEQFSEC